MAVTLSALSDLARLGFDDIIDVRSPAEYAEDHLPGAISLPVLDDGERAEVGTIYVQDSPFEARRIGAALVSRNAARHLRGALRDRPAAWRPLVYCWRGGQRSGAFALILSQIGWRAETLAGGYKAWRRLVVQAVHDAPLPAPVVVLDGNTGSAKTALLGLLAARGMQVIDLEGLAGHRGSLFGAMGPQPSQKAFEGRLAMALSALDPARPVMVEAESARIGDLALPASLWKAMRAAPRVAIAAPVGARAEYLTRAYADLTADAARLDTILESLRPWHAGETVAHWRALAQAGAFEALARGLMAAHYDPRYLRHRARMPAPAAEIAAPSLAPGALPALADVLARAVGEIFAPGGTEAADAG